MAEAASYGLAQTTATAVPDTALDPDRATAQRWLARGAPAMVVEVIEARGSVPRETGTRMLVDADAVAGTIGGGHLEWQAIARCRERLAAGDASTLDWPVALGPSLGPSGGPSLRRARPGASLTAPESVWYGLHPGPA